MQEFLILTSRLGLRFIKVTDIDDLFKLESDSAVQQFSPSGVKSYVQTKILIEEFIENYKMFGLPCFAIFNLETQEFMGRISFILWLTGDIEIGYSLHKKFWGYGYATETVAAILAWAKTNIDADCITACCAVNNKASQRVLEKCDMVPFRDSVESGEKCRFYQIKNQ